MTNQSYTPAGIVQPRPTDDEIAAARQVIERAGMKVTS